MYVLFKQIANLEKDILRCWRAYLYPLCDQYLGGRVIPHIYKYHIPLDSVPFYCSLCHFIATVKKKLVDQVTHYANHTEAAKDLSDNGRGYLHENKDPILLVEGNHFAKIGREESHDRWDSRIRRTILSLTYDPHRGIPLHHTLWSMYSHLRMS